MNHPKLMPGNIRKVLKIGVLSFPDSDVELLLSKYIGWRQKEITDEWEDLVSQKTEAG
jgi:hypothetical protein